MTIERPQWNLKCDGCKQIISGKDLSDLIWSSVAKGWIRIGECHYCPKCKEEHSRRSQDAHS